MIRPLDLLVRVVALPRIAWSASGAILDVRHRLADAFSGDSDFAHYMYDGLFDRIEAQCRARWCDTFPSADGEPVDAREAA